MGIIINSSHIFYGVKEDTEIRENADGVIAISPFFQVAIPHLSQRLRCVLMTLAQTACSARWINESLLEACEEGVLATFYQHLSCLIRHQMVFICARSGDTEASLATLLAISPYFQHQWATIQVDQRYRISRFTYIRRDEDGATCVESPLSHARIKLEHTRAASFLYQLGNAVTPLELAQALPEENSESITSFLALLVMSDFVSLTTCEGQLITENDEALMHWDFHDLVFHSRSRAGRHDNALGGTYRFLHQILPQPAVKQTSWPVTIPLFRPDIDHLHKADPSLTAVLEERISLRDYDNNPITVAQLGEFLYRVARVKGIFSDEAAVEYTQRPYPNGGASYEMEFYLTIEQCEGLLPGFYWYNPLDHTLSFIHEANKETRQLLSDANQSMGGSCRPQVLITLSARFQRVSWKYQSIAYSLILKNVGVIYATMYLVATAMNLASCALGTGDSDHFTRLSGSNYLEETSVGEFMLGSRPV